MAVKYIVCPTDDSDSLGRAIREVRCCRQAASEAPPAVAVGRSTGWHKGIRVGHGARLCVCTARCCCAISCQILQACPVCLQVVLSKKMSHPNVVQCYAWTVLTGGLDCGT